MNAPAVGTSSKAMRRPNSCAARQMPEGPPTCTACVSRRTAVVEDLRDRRAERVFVDARAARSRRRSNGSWCRSTCGVPMPAHQAPPCTRDVRRRAVGLDVVDRGRLAEVAALDRKRRADARRAALAFERFDQRRFLAADIGAGADVDVDVEIEAGAGPGSRAPSRPLLAAALQRRPAAVRAGSGIRRADRPGPRRRADRRAPPPSCPRTPSSAWRVSSTRSLKVPGSPSSALHTTTWRSAPGASRHSAHFRPVAKPAPPRPRSFDALDLVEQRRGAARQRRGDAPRRRRSGAPAARRRGGHGRRPRTSRGPRRRPAPRRRISSAIRADARRRRAGSPHGGG